jgi:hypothetical protein
MSERSGVEIDYCPECRGVWLDRGELDKIIERSGQTEAVPSRRTEIYDKPPKVQYQERGYDEHQSHNSHDQYDSRGVLKKKKKENFLADLFDFGD